MFYASLLFIVLLYIFSYGQMLIVNLLFFINSHDLSPFPCFLIIQPIFYLHFYTLLPFLAVSGVWHDTDTDTTSTPVSGLNLMCLTGVHVSVSYPVSVSVSVLHRWQVRVMNGGKHFPFTKNCKLSTPSGKTKLWSPIFFSFAPNWKKEKKKGMVEKMELFPFC